LNYLGPQGWFNRTLLTLGLISTPVKLTTITGASCSRW
jgi:putative spermidine/putrescine transport system permease protein